MLMVVNIIVVAFWIMMLCSYQVDTNVSDTC